MYLQLRQTDHSYTGSAVAISAAAGIFAIFERWDTIQLVQLETAAGTEKRPSALRPLVLPCSCSLCLRWFSVV